MALSWNEIKSRAIAFSNEWQEAESEKAEAQSFLIEFFNVFGINRRKVATFESKVRKLDDQDGYIDLLWKGTLLVEMKSRGKDLDKAYIQAKNYIDGLEQYEIPKYILVSDFNTFILYDIEDQSNMTFELKDFVQYVQHFGFIAGYQKKVYKEQDPVNIEAAELMGQLHDKLKEIGYTGHNLELYLVRLLFMLFADDTTIFEKGIFQDFLEEKTVVDGSDLASRLAELFYILNTPKDQRYTNIDEHLNAFPYVNGKLFEESLPPASFDSEMRNILLKACYLDWGKISPAIFGSMFQSVMNPVERRNFGAHYTSEKNILKAIKPLFLDELWDEFHAVKGNINKLRDFHKKLSTMKFLDPACGCGNFLVITYRELRMLELEILKIIFKNQQVISIDEIIWIDVDMMYGIELEEFPARIAEVALWLIDHQMNMLISQEFGKYFVRLPLKKAPNIINGNALDIDWKEVVSPDELSFIFGNPPFIGSKMMTTYQRDQIKSLFGKIRGSGVLDYVTGWYKKASDYITNTNIKVSYVSTNSITQGEQVSVLWNGLLKEGIKIHFAHKTFKWKNEAKGNAAVYCVIVGFAKYDTIDKTIFEYEDIKGDPQAIIVQNINPYLVEGGDTVVEKRSNPICEVPKMDGGNVAYDYGHLIFDFKEKEDFIKIEPKSKNYIKKIIGGTELINNKQRFCLWLHGVAPKELKSMKHVLDKVNSVKQDRLNAKDKGTHRLAQRPHEFRDLNNPNSFIAIPKTSSENRKYIPLAFFNKEYIPIDSVRIVQNGTIFHLGILHSIMHMVWVKYE